MKRCIEHSCWALRADDCLLWYPFQRAARASGARILDSQHTTSTGSVLSSQSTSTPSGTESANSSRQEEGEGEEDEEESDASSYHSVEMYGNWAFDELDADDVRPCVLPLFFSLRIPMS